MPARRGVRFENEDDPRGSRRRLEAERAQGGEEKRGLLEAIAAAPVGHHLLLQGFEIKPDRAAEQDIDIFEWDGVHVGREEAAKAGEIRLCWPE